MLTLDCESLETTLMSLSRIYGISGQEIKAFLKETDLDRYYAENDLQDTGDRELTGLFERTFNCSPSAIDRVFWFHLTRAKPDADFESGIFPLNEALPKVWDTILRIFKNTEHEVPLRKMRDTGVSDFQYNHKIGKPLLAGPYAMLVREVAFKSHEIGNHDYLWLPEIVEDICNGYNDASGVMLHDSVCAALVPYVIKFWSRKRTGKDCIQAAIYYLYCSMHNQKLSIYANTCYDAENVMIPREQIVKIEKIN